MRTNTKRLEFDAAHRVTRHESKCAHLHGHRYAVEITAGADALDACGRVIDFGCIKEVVGGWIDRHLDHGTLCCDVDYDVIKLCRDHAWKCYVMPAGGEPTAENIAELIGGISSGVLAPFGVNVVAVRVYETPSCWADWSPGNAS